MRTASVVVGHPFAKNPSQVTFVERIQPVQTFPPYRADHSLTERIRLRRSHGRLQHAQAHRSDRAVDGRGVDRVAVVDQEAMRGLAGDHGAALLDGPVCRRMLSHIPMHDPSRADIEHDEDIKAQEAGGQDDEEITGQNRVRVIPHKCRPALGGLTTAGRSQAPEIPSDRARRDGQPQLQPEFVRDALLAPGSGSRGQ
jgi:hypothetical protein